MIGSGPSPASAADFDQDGYADLAIGVEPRATAVNLLYGTASGISASSGQLWIQDDLVSCGTEGIDYFRADVSFDELVRTLGLAYVWQVIGVLGVLAAFSEALS